VHTLCEIQELKGGCPWSWGNNQSAPYSLEFRRL